jgi:hypothetical protein
MSNIRLLTENNHFRFGYDHRWFEPRTDASQRYTVAFGRTRRQVFDWRTECIIAACTIAEVADGPIDLLLSGGIDSEVAAQAFLLAGIPFTAHILRFADGINWHDIQYAVRFCEAHDVPHVLHDIDILKFLENDMYRYASQTQSVSPQLCATMWLIDRLDGYPVLGQGEPLLVRQNGQWSLRESEKINAWYRFFMVNDRAGVPGFHQFTPEQVLSYLLSFSDHPMLAPDSGKLSSLTSKPSMYSKHFVLEPREKYTGYEMIMDADAIHRAKLKELFPSHDDAYHIDYGVILDYLR